VKVGDMSRLYYPTTIFDEFQKLFATKKACGRYLFKAHWPNGFRYPVRGDAEYYWIGTRRLFQCKENEHQNIFDKNNHAHLPLQVWFWAACLVNYSHHRNICSSIEAADMNYENRDFGNSDASVLGGGM
jgi:hypothetical protein